MRTYRKSHQTHKTQPHAKASPDLARLLECVKNNVAIDLKAYPATILLIGSERVKNSVATAELILIQGLRNK